MRLRRWAVKFATRLAHVEVLADERRHTTTGLLLRALLWFGDVGIQVERIMTDNGSAFPSRRFAKALRLRAIRHFFACPYTPNTNSKAESFIQTLFRGSVYSLAHPSSQARNADTPKQLDWFNRSRPHSGLNGLSPLGRVGDLPRTHT